MCPIGIADNDDERLRCCTVADIDYKSGASQPALMNSLVYNGLDDVKNDDRVYIR